MNFPSRNPARKQSWQHCFHIILLEGVEGVEHQHPRICHHYWVFKESRHDPLDLILFLAAIQVREIIKLFHKGKWRYGVSIGNLCRTLRWFRTARASMTCTGPQRLPNYQELEDRISSSPYLEDRVEEMEMPEERRWIPSLQVACRIIPFSLQLLWMEVALK